MLSLSTLNISSLTFTKFYVSKLIKLLLIRSEINRHRNKY